MNFKSLDYTRKIRDIKVWAFWTAVSQFVTYLLAFVLFCMAYSFMDVPVPDKTILSNDFKTKFEVIFTLVAALLLLIPYSLSFILSYGYIYNSHRILKTWLKFKTAFAVIYFVGLLSCGIYLTVLGRLYVGCSAIVISILFLLFSIHSLLIVLRLYKYYIRMDKQNPVEIRSNRRCSSLY